MQRDMLDDLLTASAKDIDKKSLLTNFTRTSLQTPTSAEAEGASVVVKI